MENRNTKITIKTAAAALIMTAKIDTERIFDSLRELGVNESKFENVFFETMFFYINLTDRFASQYLGGRKTEFFDLFLMAIHKYLHEIREATLHRVDRAAFQNIFHATFNSVCTERQREYGNCVLAPKTEAELKEGLFWKFEERVSKVLGSDPADLIMAYIHRVISPAASKYHDFFSMLLLSEATYLQKN